MRLAPPLILVGLFVAAAAPWACRPGAGPQRDDRGDRVAQDFPQRLSQLELFTDLPALRPRPEMISFDVIVPFYSDGADKRRWMMLPPGGRVEFHPDEPWRFPIGTTFVKHFERDGHRLETRVLVCSADGVRGATYRWREDDSDADIVAEPITTESWYYPGPRDCQTCHTAAAGGVLGVTTRQFSVEQLRRWNDRGLFAAPLSDLQIETAARLPRVDDLSAPLESRARAYLDANCANCHRPGSPSAGSADFDARFATPLPQSRTLGYPARINFGVDNARIFAPRDPWRSIALARMQSLDGSGMPPLGHRTVDRAGVELLAAWINSLDGPPTLAPPRIVVDSSGDVRIVHDDPRALVRYTLDGSAPDESSAVVSGSIRLASSTTVRARAFRDGFTKSVVAQKTLVLEP